MTMTSPPAPLSPVPDTQPGAPGFIGATSHEPTSTDPRLARPASQRRRRKAPLAWLPWAALAALAALLLLALVAALTVG